jgi:hypothetical protein
MTHVVQEHPLAHRNSLCTPHSSFNARSICISVFSVTGELNAIKQEFGDQVQQEVTR